MASNARFIADLLERTVSTYVQAFLGILLGDSTHVLNIGSLHAAAVAGLPAALAVIKGAMAGSLTESHSAGFVPSTLGALRRTAADVEKDAQAASGMLRAALGGGPPPDPRPNTRVSLPQVAESLLMGAGPAVGISPQAAPPMPAQAAPAPVLPTSNPVPPAQM